MGFRKQLEQQLKSCVFTASLSNLINGTAVGYFKRFRGLKQGDPSSPCSFVLIMEALSQLMKRVMSGELIKWWKIASIRSIERRYPTCYLQTINYCSAKPLKIKWHILCGN